MEWFLELEADGKSVRALDDFEPLDEELTELFEIYGLLTTGENRVSFSDFKVYFEMEEITDYGEQHEVIFWVRKIESIQAKIRHDEMKAKMAKRK